MELNRNLITISLFIIFKIHSEAIEMILANDAPDDEDLEDERFLEIY